MFKWFSDNSMKSIANKYRLMVSTNGKVIRRIDNFDMSNGKYQKLSGFKFDHKLTFDDYISELCKKVSLNKESTSRLAIYKLGSCLQISSAK